MAIRQNIILITLIAFVLTGCATYSIQTDSLVDQIKEKQILFFNGIFRKYSILNYPSNNLKRIKCVDEKGNQVWLYPYNNAEFVFIKKSTGKKVRADFSTVIFQNDSLYGLRSRLFGGLRIIPISDIYTIAIHAEKPKIERVTN